MARPASGQVHLKQEEALRLAFPEPAVITRQPTFLSEAELERARVLAGPGVTIESAVVTRYLGTLDGEVIGVAYFDVHRVRTLQEVLMIVVTPEARIQTIEVLKFSEPPQYEARRSWLNQITGHALTDDLSLKGTIAGITGATLTAQAVTEASRRVLALHAVIGGNPPE